MKNRCANIVLVELNISLPPVLEFRQRMAFPLYANSITSNALIHKANRAGMDRHTVGILNIRSSRWFSSMLQVTASSVKETQREYAKFKLKKNNLATSLTGTHLLNSSQIPLDLLQETIGTVCSECQFQIGQQQDAEEFFLGLKCPKL